MLKVLPLVLLTMMFPFSAYASVLGCAYYVPSVSVGFYVFPFMALTIPIVVVLDWRLGLLLALGFLVFSGVDLAMSFYGHPLEKFQLIRLDEIGCPEKPYYRIAGFEIEEGTFAALFLYGWLFFMMYKTYQKMKVNPTWRLKSALFLLSAAAILPFVLVLADVRLWFL